MHPTTRTGFFVVDSRVCPRVPSSEYCVGQRCTAATGIRNSVAGRPRRLTVLNPDGFDALSCDGAVYQPSRIGARSDSQPLRGCLRASGVPIRFFLGLCSAAGRSDSDGSGRPSPARIPIPRGLGRRTHLSGWITRSRTLAEAELALGALGNTLAPLEAHQAGVDLPAREAGGAHELVLVERTAAFQSAHHRG